MKNLIVLITLLAIKAQATAWPKNYEAKIKNLKQQEIQQDYSAAYGSAVELIQELRSEIKADQVVAEVESKLTKVYDEKVVKKTKVGLSITGILLNLFFSAKYHETKMILQNAEDVSLFPAQSQVQLQGLKKMLVDYIADNAEQIAHIKILAMKAFEYSMHVKALPFEELESLSLLSSDFQFSAQQNVTVCVENNYVGRKDKMAGGLSVLALFDLEFSASQKFYAYSTTDCQSSVNRISNSASGVGIWNLSRLDQKLDDYKKIAFAKALLSPQVDQFPTFASPYY